jgi:hypothetical protein
MVLALASSLAATNVAPVAAANAKPMVVLGCYHQSCNGTSPHLTNCDQGTLYTHPWVPIKYGSTVVGYVRARESAACGTIWAQAYYTGAHWGSKVWVAYGITRTQDDWSYDYGIIDTCTGGQFGDTFCRDYNSANVTGYGYQVYDVGYTSYATGYICNQDSTCTSIGGNTSYAATLAY